MPEGLQALIESGHLAREWKPLPSVPGVVLRPFTDDFPGLRVVGRAYGTDDARWRREARFLLTVHEGLPELRSVVVARPDRVETLEQGGLIGWDRLVRAALERAAGVRSGPPVVEPLMVGYLMLPLAQAIERIHRAGYCYRALAPDTVEVSEDGLRLAVTAPIGPADPAAAPEEAQATRLYGTPSTAGRTPWSAPEVVAEGRHSPAGDVWSLGVGALELMLGRSPWRVVGGVPDLRPGTLREVLAVLRSAVRGMPGAAVLGEVVVRTLEVDPSARPGSAEVVNDLLEILLDEGWRCGVGEWSLKMVLRSLLEGGFDPVWGPRQADVWRRLAQKAPAPEPAPAAGRREVEVRFDRLEERLRVAWEVLRSGSLVLEVCDGG